MYNVCPQGTFAYLVRYGDTLSYLASMFRVPPDVILNANPGINPCYLPPNATICIPVATGQPIPTPYQEAAVPVSQSGDPVLQQGPPSGPPPGYTPSLPTGPGVYRVDPGALAPCLFKFTYLWLTNGDSFWAYLIFVGRTSAAGWRYQRNRWVYFGVDLDRIRSFTC